MWAFILIPAYSEEPVKRRGETRFIIKFTWPTLNENDNFTCSAGLETETTPCQTSNNTASVPNESFNKKNVYWIFGDKITTKQSKELGKSASLTVKPKP